MKRIILNTSEGVLPGLVRAVKEIADVLPSLEITGSNNIYVNRSSAGTTLTLKNIPPIQPSSGGGTTIVTREGRLVQNYDKYLDFCTYGELVEGYPITEVIDETYSKTTWQWTITTNGGPFCMNGRVYTIGAKNEGVLIVTRTFVTATGEDYEWYWSFKQFSGYFDEDYALRTNAYGVYSSSTYQVTVGIDGFSTGQSSNYNYVPLTSIAFLAATKQVIISNTYQVRPTIIQALEWPN